MEGDRKKGVRNNASKIREGLSNSFREVSLVIFVWCLNTVYTIYTYIFSLFERKRTL